MAQSSDDEMPELEEFEDNQLKSQNNANQFQNFAQNRADEYAENQKIIEKKLQEQMKLEEQQKLEESKKKGNQKGAYGGGLKKGFFTSQPQKKKVEKKEEKPQEIVISKQKPKEDPLKIKEVQEAMNQNDFLNQHKETWMNKDLLNNIAKNPKLQKLFTNPQYLHDIQQMQKNPKEIQAKYANNYEFQELFKEFTQTMSGHFANLGEQFEKKAQEEKKEKEKQSQKQQQMDPQVEEILKDPMVQNLIRHMQTAKQVDFHRVMQSSPVLAQKIQILIQKGYLNLQR